MQVKLRNKLTFMLLIDHSILQVKVETQPRTRTISPEIAPEDDPAAERPIFIKKQGSPSGSSGIGRLFGWS